MWNSESRKVRAEYGDRADALKAEHMLKYPHYKYTPRRPDQVKRRAKRNTKKTVKPVADKVKGTLKQGRKVLVGELNDEHIQLFSEEVQRLNEHTNMNVPVNVAVADHTAAAIQSDIDDWNDSVADSFSVGDDLQGDLTNLLNNAAFGSIEDDVIEDDVMDESSSDHTMPEEVDMLLGLSTLLHRDNLR